MQSFSCTLLVQEILKNRSYFKLQHANNVYRHDLLNSLFPILHMRHLVRFQMHIAGDVTNWCFPIIDSILFIQYMKMNSDMYGVLSVLH